MKKTSETTDLGHKPLVHPFISLTQQEDGSPCILRVDRIKTRTDIKGGARITYGNGREYEVTENCFQIGKLINEATKN